MAEELDLSGAIEMLKGMLENDEGKEQIENVLGSFTGQSAKQEMPKLDNLEMMMKIQRVMSLMNSGESSKQAAFLSSLGGILKPERRKAVDNAVKLISIGRAVKAFKEIEGL